MMRVRSAYKLAACSRNSTFVSVSLNSFHTAIKSNSKVVIVFCCIVPDGVMADMKRSKYLLPLSVFFFLAESTCSVLLEFTQCKLSVDYGLCLCATRRALFRHNDC